MQGEGERFPSPTHSPVLDISDVVLRADSPSVSAPLGDSDQAGPALSASGQDLVSSARDLEAVGMAHPGPLTLIFVFLPRFRRLSLVPEPPLLGSFTLPNGESWCVCVTHAVDPVNCPVDPVLELLQEKLVAGKATTTLKIYVAAIAARRELDEIPLGRHRMVSAFMLCV